MSDQKWLDGYGGQTTEELIALAGEYRVDSLLAAFDEAIGKKQSKRGVAALSAEERVIQAVEALQGQVNNGGYEQFFVNTSNEYAAIIVDALRRIACPLTAQITQKAIDALGTSDLSVASIEKALATPNDARDLAFIECDDSFFAYPENIDERLFAFIRANSSAITL